MRPLRFTLLLTFFVAVPVFLTCWSLFSTYENPAETIRGYNSEPSRLRALFSFSTPSTLFPPSALISLTDDNSTFFLARPAAFGPSLPSRGLSGQLWVGRGFGDESSLNDDAHGTGWELGCSDVPGWREDERKRLEKIAAQEKPQKRSLPGADSLSEKNDSVPDEPTDDGTDDYLHSPLPDSNPARPGRPGEPANAAAEKEKKPTHADIESLQESADIAGRVVLLARGGCGFLEKVKWVQRRGGVAVIVGERERGAPLTIMYAKGDTSNVTIPAIFTSYNAAHLLSSLVPDKNVAIDAKADLKKDNTADKPIFTSTTPALKATGISSKPTPGSMNGEPGWMQDALSVIGLGENAPWHAEDSRRPPGSGNIEWVLQEDWDEEEHLNTKSLSPHQTSSGVLTVLTMSTKPRITSSRNSGDDFVIGVQDWRDTDLIAPKPTMSSNAGVKNGKSKQALQSSSSLSAKQAMETLKGGSIVPGSGEYEHDQAPRSSGKPDGKKKVSSPGDHSQPHHHGGKKGWFSFFSSSKPCVEHERHEQSQSKTPQRQEADTTKAQNGDKKEDGLWVTLTPTSVSSSPFFDTLLVLVVSPLVTLTVVYALLLLRSRIRRRRWRAPKSVVERLPVRTYHTMSTTSSTTSSSVPTPDQPASRSPLIQASRPRSQTTTGIAASSQESSLSISVSPPAEKPRSRTSKRKRYNGRQIECVVCLEEYVDGESKVMSLPCGHEFHADCITPWLVNRRRTCPICKGDVVRSMARTQPGRTQTQNDQRQDGEQTSDDVQSRVAQTVNEEPSSAIPIPTRDDDSADEDEDIERGQDVDDPLLGGQPAGNRSVWRNVIARSLSRLSGDTVWRSQTPTENDRSR